MLVLKFNLDGLMKIYQTLMDMHTKRAYTNKHTIFIILLTVSNKWCGKLQEDGWDVKMSSNCWSIISRCDWKDCFLSVCAQFRSRHCFFIPYWLDKKPCTLAVTGNDKQLSLLGGDCFDFYVQVNVPLHTLLLMTTLELDIRLQEIADPKLFTHETRALQETTIGSVCRIHILFVPYKQNSIQGL